MEERDKARRKISHGWSHSSKQGSGSSSRAQQRAQLCHEPLGWEGHSLCRGRLKGWGCCSKCQGIYRGKSNTSASPSGLCRAGSQQLQHMGPVSRAGRTRAGGKEASRGRNQGSSCTRGCPRPEGGSHLPI